MSQWGFLRRERKLDISITTTNNPKGVQQKQAGPKKNRNSEVFFRWLYIGSGGIIRTDQSKNMTHNSLLKDNPSDIVTNGLVFSLVNIARAKLFVSEYT